MTPEDIEQMIKDAERFSDEDKKLKERVESRNELESYAYSLKNQVGYLPNIIRVYLPSCMPKSSIFSFFNYIKMFKM